MSGIIIQGNEPEPADVDAVVTAAVVTLASENPPLPDVTPPE